MTDIQRMKQPWYEAGMADALESVRQYLDHTKDCDTRKAEPEPCCCGLDVVLEVIDKR